MILASASTGSSAIISTTGGLASTLPSMSRPRIEARSKRNPSTCMSTTHQRSASMMSLRTITWLQLQVLPQPEKLR